MARARSVKLAPMGICTKVTRSSQQYLRWRRERALGVHAQVAPRQQGRRPHAHLHASAVAQASPCSSCGIKT